MLCLNWGVRTPFCYDLNDTAALSDADNKTTPQLDQQVVFLGGV